MEFVEIEYADVIDKLKRPYLFFKENDDYASEAEYFEDYRPALFYHEGDLHLTSTLTSEIKHGYLIVNGNLTGTGPIDIRFFVTGKADFECLVWHHKQVAVKGITTRFLEILRNDDDEDYNYFSPDRPSTATFVICYYASIKEIKFAENATVVWIGETNDLDEMLFQHPQYQTVNFVRGLYALAIFEKGIFSSFIDQPSDSAIGYNEINALEVLKNKKSLIYPNIKLDDLRTLR